MQPSIDTKDPNAVFEEAERVYRSVHERPDPAFIPYAHDWFLTIFNGRYPGYQAIDVPYHDAEHTMQGLLCLVRLLHGYHASKSTPSLPRRTFELGVLAISLHDSGYLKRNSDTSGSGAKYTLNHVERSKSFAAAFMMEQNYPKSEIDTVVNMIQYTASNAGEDPTVFASAAERIVAQSVGTADLLGQMSADDYVDRLPGLYSEFRESHEYFGEKAARLWYPDAETLIANTPYFWQSFVKPKLDHQCGGMYEFLNDPYPHGKNRYLDRIQANIRLAAQRSRANEEAG